MLLKALDDYQTLPEFLQKETAALYVYSNGAPEKNPSSYAMIVHQLDFNEFLELKAKLPEESKITGVPHYFAIEVVEDKMRLFLWPAPKEDMFACLRYCPVMKEI